MDTIREPEREVPIVSSKDVVVAGGGPSGVMAAVAAARTGASVVLIEANGYLGGVATMGLPIQGYFDAKGRQIVKGLGWEFAQGLRAIGGASPEFVPCKLHNPFLIIDNEMVKIACQEMIEQAEIEIYLHTWASGVLREGNRVGALVVENKSGREAVTGRVFVDATGDGDIACRCGLPFTSGRPDDGLTQSATLNFRLDGVDVLSLIRCLYENPERYDLYGIPREQFRTNRKHIMVGLKNLVDEARREGFEGMPFGRVCYITHLTEGAVVINMTHVQVQGQDARDLSKAELEARKQVPVILKFLRRYVPGFEKARLTSTANQIGIRETRQITGDYTLTGKDVKEGTIFDDTIAVGGYPIDIHSPTAEDVELFAVPAYGIPYRCLTPKGIDNLLVTGRCISATHEAMASSRVMATCMAIGHAAGTAAALAAREDGIARDVKIDELRKTLKNQGAVLE